MGGAVSSNRKLRLTHTTPSRRPEIEPAASRWALPFYHGPVLENEAHGSIFQYPHLLNRTTPKRFVERPNRPLFTQHIEVLLKFSALGGQGFPVRLRVGDMPLGLIEPCFILVVLPLILGLIDCHLRIGADVALHKLCDNLQIRVQLGQPLRQPGGIAAFPQDIFADLDDLVFAVDNLIEGPHKGVL